MPFSPEERERPARTAQLSLQPHAEQPAARV